MHSDVFPEIGFAQLRESSKPVFVGDRTNLLWFANRGCFMALLLFDKALLSVAERLTA